MNTISTQARLISAFFAVLTSAVIMGSTLAGITAGANAQHTMIALERAPIAATNSN